MSKSEKTYPETHKELTFICEDCKKKLPIKKQVYDEYICEDCLENYEDKTGYCSVYCRIHGSCDQTC